VRTPCVGACLTCPLATGTAHAQTDSRFAVGPDFAIRAGPDAHVQGHGHTGWGWHRGLGLAHAVF